MEWTHYRSLFFRGARKKKKKLAHNTYAFLVTSNGIGGDDRERIAVQLHKKEILTLYPNGDFEVDNHQYWRSPVTKDRFRRFLPWHGSTSCWSFNTVTHRGAAIGKARVWTLWLSGAGSHPWKNQVRYNSSGHRVSDLRIEERLPPFLNEVNANEFVSMVSPFAIESIRSLVAGEIGHDGLECPVCWKAVQELIPFKDNHAEWGAWTKHLYEAHVVPKRPNHALLLLAAFYSRREDHSKAVHLFRPDNWVLWKKPKTQRALAEQVERTLAGDRDRLGLSFGSPMHYRTTLRWDMERYLLEVFGFEIGLG